MILLTAAYFLHFVDSPLFWPRASEAPQKSGHFSGQQRLLYTLQFDKEVSKVDTSIQEHYPTRRGVLDTFINYKTNLIRMKMSRL